MNDTFVSREKSAAFSSRKRAIFKKFGMVESTNPFQMVKGCWKRVN